MMSSRRSKNNVSRRTKAALLSLERCEPRQLQSGLQGTADVTTSIKHAPAFVSVVPTTTVCA